MDDNGYEYQRIAIEKPSGGVSIMSIVTKAPHKAFHDDAKKIGFELKDGYWSRAATDDVVVAELTKIELQNNAWHRISEDDMPPADHRNFREAWRTDGKRINIHMPTAKAMLRNRVRPDKKAEIDKASTPDELLAIKDDG